MTFAFLFTAASWTALSWLTDSSLPYALAWAALGIATVLACVETFAKDVR